MAPEQQLTPEQQKENCVFCMIMGGKIPAKKVYEDDKVVAILDINPAAPGHVLLLPKEHYMIMPQVPDDILGYMFIIAKQLSASVRKAMGVPATNIFIANGAPAGQKAPHFMIHIIPRQKEDGIPLSEIPEKAVNIDDLRSIKTIMLKGVKDVFGLDLEEKEKQEQAHREKANHELPEAETEKQKDEKPSKDEEEAEGSEEENKAPEEKKQAQGQKKEKVNLDSIARLLGGEK